MTLKIIKTCVYDDSYGLIVFQSVALLCLLGHRNPAQGSETLIHSSIQQVFVEHLLYSKHTLERLGLQV